MDDGSSSSNSRWTMPLQKLGTKQYYLGIFFKVSNTFTYVNRLPHSIVKDSSADLGVNSKIVQIRRTVKAVSTKISKKYFLHICPYFDISERK